MLPVFEDEKKNELLLIMLHQFATIKICISSLEDDKYGTLESKARWVNAYYKIMEQSIVDIHRITSQLVDEDGDIVSCIEDAAATYPTDAPAPQSENDAN